MNNYKKQDRGNLSEYEAYFAGMDASMQQKIALTTAHFPSSGKIADMGSGSGRGTFDLATLYQHLDVIGVDINPVTVEYSRNQYQARNLSFAVGDIADKVFENESLDGILDSSVLHHVTSFNGFDNDQIRKTLRNQVSQLKSGGVIIIRDFVIPDHAEKHVFLDLPTKDGESEGEINQLSTSALFIVFAKDFRSSKNLSEGVEFLTHDCPRVGFSRFEVTLKTAAEFVLRKDYRDHWEPELLEEYTYFSQFDFEEIFCSNNLRIVVSMPLWNPWILANRFESKFFISDLNENTVVFPPTNFLIVGEKISNKDGVLLKETSKTPLNEPKFLIRTAYQHRETQMIYELIERPNQTIDILPWFELNGQTFVLAKKDFPRPIVNAFSEVENLNRANYSGYLTEPISAICQKNAQDQNETVVEILSERANLSKDEILEISEPMNYFPSAGGIDEQVSSYLVKISPFEKEPKEVKNYTAFKSSGYVRELDALQVLRASHVGGMFDARLEINIYRLFKMLKKAPSSWIGASLDPTIQSPAANFKAAEISNLDLKKNPESDIFDRIDLETNEFLQIMSGSFAEIDSENNISENHDFEYVVPSKLSKNSVAAIPFFKTIDGIFVGLEIRELPAAQRFTGNAKLFCVSAWRCPKEISHKLDLSAFLLEKFPKEFGNSIQRIWELGGSYFTSPGTTPEIVYPFAVEINANDFSNSELQFFELRDLLNSADIFLDAHLLILLNRLAHSLGELK